MMQRVLLYNGDDWDLFFFFSLVRPGDDWKKNLKLPPKDLRMRTSVSPSLTSLLVCLLELHS